jgi:hypothetical protein
MNRNALFAILASSSLMFPAIAHSAIGDHAEPQPGLWWSPQESGRGYALDAQGDTMVVTTFGYDDSGRMQWYYSDGKLTNGGYHWCGTLYRFDFGQPLNGFYMPPTNVGTDGTICMDFNGRVNGTLTLPSGRRVAIQRQNFGVGDPPNALLGGWLFAYTIGSTSFADTYTLTQVAPGTSTGNGLAIDLVKRAGFEYQVSGPYAGMVEGVHIDSAGNTLDAYLFQLQMEEGRGAWVSPLTNSQYGMNAYKARTPQGLNKRAAPGVVAADLAARGLANVTRAGVRIDQLAAHDPELAALARRTREALEALEPSSEGR